MAEVHRIRAQLQPRLSRHASAGVASTIDLGATPCDQVAYSPVRIVFWYGFTFSYIPISKEGIFNAVSGYKSPRHSLSGQLG